MYKELPKFKRVKYNIYISFYCDHLIRKGNVKSNDAYLHNYFRTDSRNGGNMGAAFIELPTEKVNN